MASRRNMFLSMMQEKDAASAPPAAHAASNSAPVSPPTGSESGSARSLPAIRGAEPAPDVDPLGSSQPLGGAMADAAPSPASSPHAAPSAAWEDAAPRSPAAATGRAQPGMRYEIYDFSTAELRAELANCRRQPDAAGWRDWASWITDELDERVAGEDIFSAITNLADGSEFDDGDEDEGAGGHRAAGAGADGSAHAGRRSESVASSTTDSPTRRAKPERLQSDQRSGEAEERRRRAAELNRTSGGARRNAKKKKKSSSAPAWAAQQAEGAARPEENAGREQQAKAPRAAPAPARSPMRNAQPRSSKAQPRAARAQPFELPNVKLDMPPSGGARHQQEPAAQQAPPAEPAPPAPTQMELEQQQERAQQLDLAVVGNEPRQSSAAPLGVAVAGRANPGDMAAMLEKRSASLDKRMEDERQQVWLQQQAAEAEAARLALQQEQERERERELKRRQEEQEQAEAAHLARQLEEEKRRLAAQEKARLDAQRRKQEQIAAAEAETRRKEQLAADKASAAAAATAEADAEARRQREAKEVAELEVESKRRIEEARQIKAAMAAAKQRKEAKEAAAAAAAVAPVEVETNEAFEVRKSAVQLPAVAAEPSEQARQQREADDAAEVAQLEEESKRRMEEARQIKASMLAAKQRKETAAQVAAAKAKLAAKPQPDPEPEPEPEPELRSVFAHRSDDRSNVRRSTEQKFARPAHASAAVSQPLLEPEPEAEPEPEVSAEVKLEALRQRAADVKERREEIQARAVKRQDQARKSAELANPRAVSESPTRMSAGGGGAVANGRRSRNSKAVAELTLNSAGQMVKTSSAQDGSNAEAAGDGGVDLARQSVTRTQSNGDADGEADDTAGPLQPQPQQAGPKKSKPARARRSSAAVVPPRELSKSETLIAGHYPTLAQIFGAAHLDTTEPFNLPECVSSAQQAIEKWKSHLVEEGMEGLSQEKPERLCYCVQPKDHKKETDVYDIVTGSAGRLPEWTEIPWERRGNHSFNLLWSWSNPHKGKNGVDTSKLLVWQRVNRYPDSKPLTRKDSLKRNLQRYSALPGDLGAAFDCFPETFNLPSDYKDFLAEFNRVEEEEGEGAENIWIMKPVGSSRGRGIFLISDLNDVSYSEDMVVQRYIANPLLIDGFKFDLRLYVCVLSFQPLEAYIHKQGFARYSSAEYSCDKESLENNFIHLTNSSINNAKSTNAQSGSKQSLDDLWVVLDGKGIEREPIWQRICEVVLRSLFCVVEKMGHHPNCFELFGYDVLIDADLKCHLIEVNSSPALTRHNPLDHDIKGTVITDTIRLATPPTFNRSALSELLQKSGGGGGSESGSQSRAATHDLAHKLHGVLGDEYVESGSRLVDKAQPSEERLGGFEQLAPSKTYDSICRPFGRARPR